VVEASTRAAPKSQDTQLYDVAELAEHFGVSRLAALYRLRNLRFLSDAEFENLKQLEEAGHGRAVAELLQLPQPDEKAARDEYRHRFLSLALEAFRRKEISRSKLNELASMIDLGQTEVWDLLERIGLLETGPSPDVLAPAE